jgi:hypothetical protein
MRFLVPLGLVLALCAASARAGEDAPRCGGLDPDAIARLILEADAEQQALVAQAMRDANTDVLMRVHQAIRKLAPEFEREKAARGPEPEPPEIGDGPLHLVNVEVRFLDAETNFLRDVGVDMRGLGQPASSPASDGASAVAFLDDVQREVILRAAEKSERVTPMAAARITVYDPQRANVSVLDPKSFVSGVERVDLGDGSVAAKPVLEVAQEGLVLNLRPTLSKDRRFITLELSLLVAELVDPQAPKSIVCAGKTVPLTMPTTCLQQMRSSVCIPDGGTVLISQKIGSAARSRLTLVTAGHMEMTARELREAVGDAPAGGNGEPAGK